jgi:hypothetical protein
VISVLQALNIPMPIYKELIPKMARALAETNETKIIDMCSGSGGPMPYVVQELRHHLGMKVTVHLTDLVPNVPAMKKIADGSDGAVTFSPTSVNALNCKDKGFRTICGSFHHFDTEMATAIIQDAVKTKSSIGVFEAAERSVLNVFFMFPVVFALLSYILSPFAKPFRYERLFFTYVIPLVPFITAWDGCVRCVGCPCLRVQLAISLPNVCSYV